LHTDMHSVAFGPDHTVWNGDDGGVYHYTPSTHAVTDANGNLNITQFYFGFNEVGGTLLAGSQDNASATTSSSTLSAWTSLWSGDGGPSAITPNDKPVQFIESDSHLYVTTNSFASPVKNITPPALGLFSPPMILVPNTTTPAQPTVFYGGPDFYRTTNPTAATPTWTKVTSVGKYVTAIAADPANSNVIYIGFRNGTVEVSTNGGVSFVAVAKQPFTTTYVTGISVDPSNPKAITASFSYNDTRYYLAHPHVAQYVYTSTPSSGAWSVITGNLPAIGAVSHVVYDSGSLVAATDAGVYATATPAGSSTLWSLVGTGLPTVQVQDLFVDPVGGRLYAVTHGRGAWVLP